MTAFKGDPGPKAGGEHGSARVEAQLDALHGRWEGVRRNITELSHAGAEAWRAVEPDARRLMAEMRDVLDRAGDRFREARAAAPNRAAKRAKMTRIAPSAAPAAPQPSAGMPDDPGAATYAAKSRSDPHR